jgi:3-methylcrotonyl-CoA carboxylase alpha subunit
MIRKILIANRGEIAVRVIKTCRRMGIGTAAVHSALDADSLFTRLADEAFLLEGGSLAETYLNIDRIVETAIYAGCDAIHPGYGFLAENPLFVKACEAKGLIFIGPGSEAMRLMGNKIEARSFARKAGVPVTEGMTGTREELLKARKKISFPVLIKAAAGGGGKGMQIVRDGSRLEEALESASRQALAYFGDETVYLERYLDEPRHIEFQILGDNFGNVIHLFERECSIQRRYQKIIEESPSPTLTPEIRARMGEAAVRLGRAVGYRNAGTIEFLVDRDLQFYFLEMNTRIQVEHPVTELVTGTDIVEEQIRIASGEPLRLKQDQLRQQGHAIECRIYAEDPSNQFMPSPGRMTLYREPESIPVRIDTGVTGISEIRSAYDPLIAKLIVHGADREEAARLVTAALDEYIIQGIRTNIGFLAKLIRSDAFRDNLISTGFCDLHTEEIVQMIASEKATIPPEIPVSTYLLATLHDAPAQTFGAEPGISVWKSIGYWRNISSFRVTSEGKELEVVMPVCRDHKAIFEIGGRAYRAELLESDGPKVSVQVDGELFHAWLSTGPDQSSFLTLEGHTFILRRADLLPELIPAASSSDHHGTGDHVTAPMPGKVIKIHVKEGQEVSKGALLLVLEAMKMENAVVAPRDAVIRQINVTQDQLVEVSTPLVVFEPID